MTTAEVAQLALIAVAAVLAPVVVGPLRRFAIPAVVFEIMFGIVLGPQVLDLVRPTGIVAALSTLGLTMLMFLAGYELRLSSVAGDPLRLAGLSWGMSVVLAGLVGLVIHLTGALHGEWVTTLALTTTALGTLLPVLRDSGVLKTDFGRYALAVGSVAEFGPIVLVAVVLGAAPALVSVLLLAAYGLLVVGAALLAHRPWGAPVTKALRRGLHASSQLPIRVTLLFLLLLALVAGELGIDVLLGAFAGGVVVRIATGPRTDPESSVESDPESGEPDTDGKSDTESDAQSDAQSDTESDAESTFATKMEAIAFGMLVPVFFVVSGTRIDLVSLTASPGSWVIVPVFLLLMVVVRGTPVLFCYRTVLPRRQRLALAVMSGTGLPLIVVITTIGTTNGFLSTADAAAMVAAGMLSVLVLPSVALSMLGRDRDVPAEPGAGL